MFFATPAVARDHYVLDQAGLFSSATVQNLDREISAFNAQTGKEVVVETVSSLNGGTLSQAAENAFAQQQVNGVLLFMAKAERQDGIIGDKATAQFFPPGTFKNIRDAMRGYFRSGDFDTGIQTGVSLVLDQYRSHERALGSQMRRLPTTATSQQTFGGFGLFWFILIAFAGFLIIRALFRALTAPRIMPPGYGGPGYGGPNPSGFGGGYGGPGYGGGGFGGGGFMSGLLGGLGGAWLGNQLFGNHNPTMTDGMQNASFDNGQNVADSSGWQSDAGQADMSNASFGGFDDSGSGGFDSGGGGGFDSGGGGDSGGGW
jgi:uncharacterized protein